MTNVLKKRILISPEQQSAQLGAFFQELGFELSAVHDKELTKEYQFIVDDFLPELKFYPRIQTTTQFKTECLPDVRAFIDVSKLNHLAVKQLLSLYFSNTQSFDLIDRYSSEFKNVYNFKIHDYLNIGYFIDTIVIEAYKNKFDIEQIRGYLNYTLPYALKKLEKTQVLAPLDVTFSCSEEGFALQIAMSAAGIEVKKEFHSESLLMKEIGNKTNFLDASYFSKRDRLILSSLWFKDESLKNYQSHFFTEISARSRNGASLINILDQNGEEGHFEPVAASELAEVVAVKAYVEPELGEFQRVLGSKQLEDLFAVTVSGGDPAEEELWKVKSAGLPEKLEQEITRIKALNQSVEEEDLVRIIADQLDADPENVKTLVKGVMEEAEKNIQVQRIQVDANKEKMEGQIVRMKKVIEQMKAEMIKLRNDAESKEKQIISNTIVGEQNTEAIDLKKSLGKTMEIMRNKEKVAVKFKSDVEQIMAAKDEKIAALEKRVLDQKDDFFRSTEFADEEKLEQLQSENKSLTTRLDLANRKINIISSNMEKQESGSNAKKDKEISNLKSSIQMAQALIDKFKQERNDLEVKLNEEREKVSKLRDDKSNDYPTKDSIEKDKQIIIIATEKKILEEKFRAQTIEQKKLEQKLKFTLAQLEESQRKKVIQPGQAVAKSNDIYLKQLENANSRLADMSADLGEKKKEIHKLKAENTVLATKASELERKLGNIDKKAA